MWCRKCAAEGVKSIYIGESGNSCHERGAQHLQEWRSESDETKKKSVLRKHIEDVHGGDDTGVEYDMKITHRFKNDPLGRQVMEGVAIRETVADNLMNSKDEFCQPGEIIPELPSQERRNRSSHNNNQSVMSQQQQPQQTHQQQQLQQSPQQQVEQSLLVNLSLIHI